MRRWLAVLVLVMAAATAGCDSAEEREAALREQLFAAVKAVPGVAEYHVATKEADGGFAVDADVRLAPAAGQAAAGIRQVRAALTGSDEVRSVKLQLVVLRGPLEHDGRWYDTAGRPEFDRQAALWGRLIDAGGYRRVGAMSQTTTRFGVFVQGWAGAAGDRPSAAEAYRGMVAAAGAAGLRTEDLDLSAAPTERVQAGSDGGAALPDAVLAAGEEIGRRPSVAKVTVSGWSRAPSTRIRIYPVERLGDAERGRILDLLRPGGLLGGDLEVVEGSGAGRPIWPAG